MNKRIMGLSLTCLIVLSLVGCSQSKTSSSQSSVETTQLTTEYIDKTNTELVNKYSVDILYKGVTKDDNDKTNMIFGTKIMSLQSRQPEYLVSEYKQNNKVIPASATIMNDKNDGIVEDHIPIENNNPVTLSIYFEANNQKHVIYERAYYPASSKKLTF